MPIRFRCGYCNRLLGIARRKAGTHTTCPHCSATIAVPSPDEYAPADEPAPGLADVDELLKADRNTHGSGESPVALASPRAAEGFTTAPSAPATNATPAPTAGLTPPARSRRAAAVPTEDLPLAAEESRAPDPVVRDVDTTRGREPAFASQDEGALSLDDEPRGVVLTPQKLTALAAAGVGLLILAFTAGYFVGAR